MYKIGTILRVKKGVHQELEKHFKKLKVVSHFKTLKPGCIWCKTIEGSDFTIGSTTEWYAENLEPFNKDNFIAHNYKNKLVKS